MQFALVSLVKKMAIDHPYHTIFQVYKIHSFCWSEAYYVAYGFHPCNLPLDYFCMELQLISIAQNLNLHLINDILICTFACLTGGIVNVAFCTLFIF